MKFEMFVDYLKRGTDYNDKEHPFKEKKNETLY
jgi:uncharacterized protein YheU (UPF0270 family)